MGVACAEFVCTPLLLVDVTDLRCLSASDLRVDTFENDNWAAERLKSTDSRTLICRRPIFTVYPRSGLLRDETISYEKIG